MVQDKDGSFRMATMLRGLFRAKPDLAGGASPMPSSGRPCALIATHHLGDFGGSEIIALEMTRYFVDAGYRVDVYANWQASPVSDLFRQEFGIDIMTDPRGIRPFHYDVVYFQHHVAPLFLYDEHPDDAAETKIVFGRLARRTFMETGGWAHDNALGDMTLANSELTAERLIETGVSHPIRTVYNAAPSAYVAPARHRPTRPAEIVAITNHADPALLDALARLRAQARVTHIGRSGDRICRITPEIIHGADLVISIGKSIPYALVSRTPAYVYDHFGGPGYLTAETFQRSARYNFTGRCCERRLSGEAILTEILAGYGQAAEFAALLDESLLERYRFEAHMEQVLQSASESTDRKRERLQAAAPQIELEKMLARHLRESIYGQPQL